MQANFTILRKKLVV